jgi:putative SOS response-associated peptidase YedK
MPVILEPKDYEQWLDPEVHQTNLLQPMLRSYPAGDMTTYPVSLRVNNPRNDDSKCIEPM